MQSSGSQREVWDLWGSGVDLGFTHSSGALEEVLQTVPEVIQGSFRDPVRVKGWLMR